jgi:hypothetical protein
MKRLPLPDLLKGFAVFLIIPVHILELFIDYPGKERLFGKILLFMGGPVAVPVFMMVMGYFIAKNKKTFNQNLIRGVKVFALGFFLNIGLNFHLLLQIRFAGWPIKPLEYILGVDILYLAGLSLMFLSALKLLKTGREWIALCLVFLIPALTFFMNDILMIKVRNYILPFIAGKYSWSYFPLFPWLAYPLAGFTFFLFEKKLMAFFDRQKIVFAIILVSIFVGVIYFGSFGFKTTVNLPAYYHHTFRFLLWVLGIVILWAVFWRFILNRFPKTLAWNFFMWLGRNITLFYIIQWLIIGNIATAVYQTQDIDTYFYWFAPIFSITILFTWLLEKTHIKPAG